MKTFLRNKLFVGVLLVAVTAVAADTVLNTDRTKIGRKVSSGDKVLEFDNNSVNNPQISTTPAQNNLRLRTGKVQIGTGTAVNQSLEFATGASPAPAIRWNQTQSKIEFTNDGTNFKAIGSGSGSGAGINLIENSGFEDGTVGFQNTGGVVDAVTSGTNLLFGTRSVTFDASAAAQVFEVSPITIPEILLGRNCLARIHYKGGNSNLVFEATDGSNVQLASQVIQPFASVRPLTLNFPCPTSGQIKWRVRSTADAALIALDQVTLGEADNLSQVSQATFAGGMEQVGATSCDYLQSTSSGISNFVALGTGTGCNPWTIQSNGPGMISAQGTNDHRLVYTDMAPGNYQIVLTGLITRNAIGSCYFRLNDGTNNFQVMHNAGGATAGMPSLIFHATYNTAGTRTFTIQASDDHASSCGLGNGNANTNLSWKIYRFPVQSELAIRTEQTLDTLGSVFYAASSQCPVGSLPADGSAVSRTIYASLFQRLGTTHGAGDGSTTFNLPDLRGIFVRGTGSQTVGGQVYSGTLGTKQTDQFQGHEHNIQARQNNVGTGGTHSYQAGTDVVARNTAGIISDGVNGTPRVGTQTQPANIALTPCISFSIAQAPLLVGSVTSRSTGALAFEFAHVGQAAYQTSCTTSPCSVFRPSSNWINSVTRTSTGIYVVSFLPNIFSSGGICTCSAISGGIGPSSCSISDFTNSQVTVYTHTGAGTNRDSFFDLTCQGPR